MPAPLPAANHPHDDLDDFDLDDVSDPSDNDQRIEHHGERGAEALWEAYVDAGRPPNSAQEDALARHYLPYATQVGERFSRRVGDTVDRDDIVQNGYWGLLEAIRTFDPAVASFQTYANRKIQWKIADGLRGGDWLPRRRRDNVKVVQTALLLLQQKNKTNPTDDELAQATGLSVEEVRLAYEDFVASKVHSLNDLTGGAGAGEGEDHAARISDRTYGGPEDEVMHTALHAIMYSALKVLPERDKQIIALYYYGEHTLAEIGQVFDIGYSRVSQLLKRAVFMLRTTIEADA